MNLGGYVVKARLGQGGFGTVYLVEQEGVAYAAKLLPLEHLGAWGEREVLVLTKVRHDNAVRLLGHFHYPARAPRFFVVIMGYVEGRRLDVWVRTENPSARRVVRHLLDVARALAAVHEARALHRDVKEANIIVRKADGAAVLVDFGVGSDEDVSRLTGGALPPGTLNYLSPEAWRFHREHAGSPGAHYPSAPADDVYALGVTLYWLLTDVKPFEVEPSGSREAVLTRAPVAPHVRNPAVPAELSALCLRLLAKRPEERPDARALCAALEALLSREGPAWEAPLCEYREAHNTTTLPEPGADAVARWLQRKRRAEARPRRGVPPPSVAQAEAPPAPTTPETRDERPRPVAAPQAAAPSPQEASTATPPPASGTPEVVRAARLGVADVAAEVSAMARRPRVAGWVGLVLVVGLAVLVGGRAWRSSRVALSSTTPSVRADGDVGGLAGVGDWHGGGKVAPPWKLPEVTASSVEPTATPPQEEAPVMTPPQKKTVLATLKKAAAVASTCSALGCAGAPVRHEPEPEPCPSGALEAMKKLDIDVWDEGSASLFFEARNAQRIPVTEGMVNVRYAYGLGDLPKNSRLSGRLIFGERVYGRLTRARSPDGKLNIPVCLEIREFTSRGLEYKGTPGPTTATVISDFGVRAVRQFE